jgi:ABC-type transport system substrate-binding protein
MDDLNTLRDSLLEGRLGRRAFLAKALGLGLSLPAAGALLSAWGRGGVGVATAATGAAPKRGGVPARAQLRAGHARPRRGRQRDDLDDHDDLRPARRVPGGLADPQPGLASSWTFADGGKTVVFHLRRPFSTARP